MAYMSQEGYDNLVAELKQLVTVERPKASAAIAEARDKGDLSENSEYDAAKEAQAHLEDKINRLKLSQCRGSLRQLYHRVCWQCDDRNVTFGNLWHIHCR